MNLPKRQYICKIHGICLLKPSRSLEFTIFLQISAKKKAADICFLENQNEKAVSKIQIYHMENPLAI
jgi:hypothetical protein